MTRTMKLFTILPAAALVLGLGTAAHAQDAYQACFNNVKQKVRASSLLVNATPICKVTETLHSWNETGPQGPQGSPGFTTCGPEEVTGTCNANTFAVLNLTCSGTGHAMGASAIWHSPFDAADNGPFYILPRTDNTWTVVPYNHTGISQTFRFFLQCCH